MKKILSTLAISGLTVAAFGQGTVNWTGIANLLIAQTNGTSYSSFTPPSASTPAPSGTVGATAGSGSTLYYYELLVSSSASTAPTTTAALSSWQDTGLSAQNTTVANGRLLQNNASNQAIANNWGVGVTENVILVGWSANLGSTWQAALGELQNWSTDAASIVGNAFFGVSSVGSLAAQSGNPGVTVFGVGPGQIDNPAATPMQLNELAPAAVPEPATMALAGLGGLSLLAFRRKK